MHGTSNLFFPLSILAKCLAILSLSLQAAVAGNLQFLTTNSSLAAYIQPINAQQAVKLGIDVLQSQQYEPLRGKRVGLLTHPAGVNRYGQSTVNILFKAPDVDLVALYGPEHGIYGNEKAGQHIEDRRDPRTGLPVFSLYGSARKPSPQMLAGVEVLVIDLQDIGTRSYTYVSCMKMALEACFENSVEVIVLDRPNPLGGLKVDGPPIETKWQSYVGAFPVPYVHGLTIGELARMAVTKPGILNLSPEQLANGRLTVVTMDGWNRSMSWPSTRLKWIPTSPNIPDFQSAIGYAMTGLGAQLGGFSHGIGSEYPFRILTFDGVNTSTLKAELESQNIPGLRFNTLRFRNNSETGLYVSVTDWKAWRPTELSFHMMRIAAKLGNNPFANASEKDVTLFNKFVGSSSWWAELNTKGTWANLAGYLGSWDRQAKQFQLQSRQYWLYD